MLRSSLYKIVNLSVHVRDAGGAKLHGGGQRGGVCQRVLIEMALGEEQHRVGHCIRHLVQGGVAVIGVGVALFIYFFISSTSWGAVTGAEHAVVVQPELTLRSGPSPEYKEMAVVHDGLEVILRERRPGYVLIQIPGGDGGWVESASVEPIFAR